MLAFGMPGPMETLILGIIVLFVFILPLTALVIVVTVLANKKKKQLDDEPQTDNANEAVISS